MWLHIKKKEICYMSRESRAIKVISSPFFLSFALHWTITYYIYLFTIFTQGDYNNNDHIIYLILYRSYFHSCHEQRKSFCTIHLTLSLYLYLYFSNFEQFIISALCVCVYSFILLLLWYGRGRIRWSWVIKTHTCMTVIKIIINTYKLF